LVEAAKILRKHLNPFVQYHELGEEVVSSGISRGGEAEGEGLMDRALQERLSMPISQLDLSVRASNCLESAKVSAVGDLARMTETDLLKVRSFGRTSLREVKRKLADLGLSLGMSFSDTPTGQAEGMDPNTDNKLTSPSSLSDDDDTVTANVTLGE